jgi:transcriptional regulator with XRE-family HTH domain
MVNFKEGYPVDVAFVIRQRLADLGCEQRDLARASAVTESYISQLLTRKKAPPAPNRTDIYDKMETFLQLPRGELAKLADLQRQEELQGKLGEPPAPLFQDMRALILRKCPCEKEPYIRTIFAKQPFGELERLVTQKLLDVVKNIAREELASETWLRSMARLGDRSYEQMRVIVLEFLDADIFNVSGEHCVAFLEPLLESWDIDLATFGMEIVLNRRLVPEHLKKFEFLERVPEDPGDQEPGLKVFLKDRSLSGDAAKEEIDFLKRLKFKGKRPTPLYYYRELQNLRDPLHFRIL